MLEDKMKPIFVVVLLLLHTIYADSETPKWNYDETSDYGPSNWHKSFNLCKSEKQSPIDIIHSKTDYKPQEDFKFNDYYSKDTAEQFLLENNGHTVQLKLNDGVEEKIVEGGGLDGKYKLVQFHLHWGSNNDKGSEHAFDGKKYAMELHLVHMSTKYPTLGEAVEKDQGLAVLGILVDVGKKNNHFEKFIKEFEDIKYKNMSVNLKAKLSAKELLPGSLDEFYRYQGSLTTPPCAESVVWSIFKKHVEVSQDQLDKFRGLYFSEENATDAKRMVDNDRPLQKLQGRVVHRSFRSAASLPSFPSLLTSLSLLLVAVGGHSLL